MEEKSAATAALPWEHSEFSITVSLVFFFHALNPLTTPGHLVCLSSASEIDRSILSETQLSLCLSEYLHSSSSSPCHPNTIPSVPVVIPLCLSHTLLIFHSLSFSLFWCTAPSSLGVCVCACTCVCIGVCV